MALFDDIRKYYNVPDDTVKEAELSRIFEAVLKSIEEDDYKTYSAFLKLAHGGAPAPQRKRAEPAPESPSADSAKVYAYTDGACLGNPGPGGWGVVIAFNGAEQELSGGEALTTNNRMELTAAIEALRVTAGQHSGTAVIITTDSQYVKNGIMQWIAGWKRNGWKTADKKEVKNKDLWIKLDELNALLRPEWKWVKGHSGHYYNERCDELAVAAARYYKENGR